MTQASCYFPCNRGNRIGMEAKGLLVLRAQGACGGGSVSCLNPCLTWGSWAQWDSTRYCEIHGAVVQVKCWAV